MSPSFFLEWKQLKCSKQEKNENIKIQMKMKNTKLKTKMKLTQMLLKLEMIPLLPLSQPPQKRW